MEYFDILSKASNIEGLEFSEKKYHQFMKYKDLIKEWNEKVNLTAIKDDEGIIKKHFIDSMKKKALHKDAELLKFSIQIFDFYTIHIQLVLEDQPSYMHLFQDLKDRVHKCV